MIIVVDVIIWILVHLFISNICVKLGDGPFIRDNWLYRKRAWEQEGKWYERLAIRKWKEFAPDAGVFKKKHLRSREYTYFEQFVLETRRAELAHWLPIPFSFLFFLWSEVGVGWVMVAYALCFHAPLIMIQRYNRIRLQRIIGTATTRLSYNKENDYVRGKEDVYE